MPSFDRVRSGLFTPYRAGFVRISAALTLFFGLSATAICETTTNQEEELYDPYPASLSGSYLAARHAEQMQDLESAVEYYREAHNGDPENEEILEQTFKLLVANGDLEDALKFAERLVAADKNNRMARLVLGIKAHKERSFDQAQIHFAAVASQGPLAELTANLLTAWSLQGGGKTDEALKWLDSFKKDSNSGVFGLYHGGLIASLAGRREDAVARLEKAYEADSNALRIADAYVRGLARVGKMDEARRVALEYQKRTAPHPLLTETLAAIDAGKQPAPLVSDAQAGAGEVLYWLGSAIGRDGYIALSTVYLQLALYLDPKAELAKVALAAVFERQKQYERAIALYLQIDPASPLKRGTEIQIGLNYSALDELDKAREHLQKQVDEDPSDLEAVRALGNVLRRRKLFTEAADVYSRGIATLDKPTRDDWALFYYRAICYEQSKIWPKAEADLKLALELSPNEPDALNYLGYSWIDMSMHLDEAMDMIKKAVELRPNDGYIVDSLGWAYFKLGRYDDAVRQLERAVELRATDPIINDHLGDAYWMVGRKLEAQFQWSHARDLEPTPENLELIKKKLAEGLKLDGADAAANKIKKSDRGG